MLQHSTKNRTPLPKSQKSSKPRSLFRQGGVYEHGESMRPDHRHAWTRPRKPVRTDLHMGRVPPMRHCHRTGLTSGKHSRSIKMSSSRSATATSRRSYACKDETAAGMGIHFLNRAVLGPAADPMRPQILLYEPVGDKLQLRGGRVVH